MMQKTEVGIIINFIKKSFLMQPKIAYYWRVNYIMLSLKMNYACIFNHNIH